MRSLFCVFFFASIAIVNAHFQLQYPPPRGTFQEEPELTFCDGYDNAGNRTVFPLNGGFISLKSEHPDWTLGVLVSTVDNPNNFDNFTDDGKPQFAFPYQEEDIEGDFCVHIDLAQANVTGGLQSGQNISIEIVFAGPDGQLYQCADLTLSDNATIPSDISCANATSTSSGSNSTSSSTSTSSSSSSSSLVVVPYTVQASLVAAVLGVMAGALLVF